MTSGQSDIIKRNFCRDGKLRIPSGRGKVWSSCRKISDVLVTKFRMNFNVDGLVITRNQEFYNHLRQHVVCVEFNAGLIVMTVQDRYDEGLEPFVYLDSISIKEHYRGTGLALKYMQCMSEIVSLGIFKHLNTKDWSDGFWEKIMPRFPFVREKYSNGWMLG